MDQMLENRLYEKYPTLFADRDLSPRDTAMCWGCDCGDGWYNLIDETCKKIMEIDTEQAVRFGQVKQKFGALRIYLGISDTGEMSNEDVKKIYGIVDDAEEMSMQTCEMCGEHGNIRDHAYIRTLCDKCCEEIKGGTG